MTGTFLFTGARMSVRAGENVSRKSYRVDKLPAIPLAAARICADVTPVP